MHQKISKIAIFGPKSIFCNFLLFAQKMARNFLHFAKNEKRKKSATLVAPKQFEKVLQINFQFKIVFHLAKISSNNCTIFENFFNVTETFHQITFYIGINLNRGCTVLYSRVISKCLKVKIPRLIKLLVPLAQAFTVITVLVAALSQEPH